MNVLKTYYVADFETATPETQYFKDHQDTRVLLWNIQSLQDDTLNQFGTSIETFIQFLKDNGKSAIVYFHNLTWDGNFIWKYLVRKLKVQVYDEIPHMKQGMSIFRSNGQIYQIKAHLWNRNKKLVRFQFRCSLKLLSEGIENLGVSYGIQKHKDGDGDDFYDEEPRDNYLDYPPRFLEYCENDVKIMKLALTDLKKNIDHIMELYNEDGEYKYQKRLNIFNCLTIGAASYKLCTYFAEKFGVKKFPDAKKATQFQFKRGLFVKEKTYRLGEKLFYGGWVDFNHSIQDEIVECPNGLAIDINSAHPNSMTMLLPYGEILDQPPINEKYLEYVHVKVGYAKAKHHAFTPLRNWNKVNNKPNEKDVFGNYRYVPEMYNFECWYLKDEWDFICQHYEMKKVKIIKSYYFYADYFYKDLIDMEYYFKSHYKEIGQTANSQTYKILLNSGYGKHATREVYDNEFFIQDRQQFNKIKAMKYFMIKKKTKDKIYKIKSYDETDENMLSIIATPIAAHKYYNKVLAATITAYTRLKLWQGIIDVGVDNWLYSDTDSCYFKDGSVVKLDIDKWRLGAWDIESRFNYFQVRRSKSYFIMDKDGQIIKSKFAGVNKQWLKKNGSLLMTSNWNTVIKECSKQVVQTESGVVLQEKDLTLTKTV